MKILEINNHGRIIGGSDTVYQNTSELLEKYGHEVMRFHCTSANDLKSDFDYDLPQTRNFKSPKLHDFFNYIWSKEAQYYLKSLLVKSEKIDIAHLHIYYGNLTTSILKPLKDANIPIIQTLHEYKLACPIYTFTRGDKICTECVKMNKFSVVKNKCKNNSFTYSSAVYIESIFSRLNGDVSAIDHFICVSEFQKKIMLDAGVPAHKCSVLYNAVSVPPVRSTLQAERDDYILYVGRIETLKGVFTLANAAKISGKRTVFLGDGQELKNLKDCVAGYSNIEILGHQPKDVVQKYMNNAQALVVPSEWYENCPMSVLEAKALGTLVIGSDIGGIPELVRDNIDGILFEAGNIKSLTEAIEKMSFIDVKEYSRLAIADAEDRFSEKVYYEKLLNLFTQVKVNKGLI